MGPSLSNNTAKIKKYQDRFTLAIFREGGGAPLNIKVGWSTNIFIIDLVKVAALV